MSITRTDKYRLLEAALGRPLADFVAERRRVDAPPFRPPMGWEAIAEELSRETGIEVNRETLRLWFSAEARQLLPVEPAGGRP